MNISRLAYFLLLGKSAEKVVGAQPEVAPKEELSVSKTLDLALALPETVKSAARAAIVFRYLFVFENFLRDLIKDTLSEDNPEAWWELKVPNNVKEEVARSRETEEAKAWMALGARENISLTTYPQLIQIIEHRWKSEFEDVVKDKSLLQQARLISHMRNAICHMTDIPDEEVDRIRQVLRDWFRAVAP